MFEWNEMRPLFWDVKESEHASAPSIGTISHTVIVYVRFYAISKFRN